jgi:hypothetical protein
MMKLKKKQKLNKNIKLLEDEIEKKIKNLP